MKHEILTKDGIKVVDLNRRKAARLKCLDCSGWLPGEVEKCGLKQCPLYDLRDQTLKQDAQARAWAIRKFCIVCMDGEKAYVRQCKSIHCALWPFRTSMIDKSREVI